MLFSTLFFIYVFLAVLAAVYFIFGRNVKVQNIILTVFSLFFYAFGEPVYVLLMIGLVAVNFFFGKLCAAPEDAPPDKKKKLLLAAAVAIDLGVLGLFKYTNFFISNLNAVFSVEIPFINLTMPIGISFFTFQAMSYVIDTYRGVTKPQKSFVNLLLYVSFFPQLIAGPIVRYQDIELQLQTRDHSLNHINDGIFRFSLGLAKKVLIADSCDKVVRLLIGEDPKLVLAGWAGVVFYSLQLYFDFSGYSDMAIGLGKIFGFDFPENFNYPFASKSVSEYWRRWHISLGTWFKDYLFYPVLNSSPLKKLSKSLMKKKKRNAARYLPTVLSLFVVWAATGLWHGASWNFVLWGIYYYILLTVDMLWLDKFKKKLKGPAESVFSHGLLIIATFFGMALFYFEKNTFANLGMLFGIGAEGFTGHDVNAVIANNVWLLLAGAVLSVPTIPAIYKKIRTALGIGAAGDRIIKTVCALGMFLLATVRMVGQTYSPFMYFRF
ncbi:MAG: MBOAT family protein [Clostridia bacterium]|nr:MBOAT family protein [Clostridia bacterium]